jgi:hypothetical protein
MKRIMCLLIVLVLTSCQISAPVDSTVENEPRTVVPAGGSEPTPVATTGVSEPTLAANAEESEPLQFVPVDPDDPSENHIARDLSVEISGSEEIVFDWTTDRCEEEHIPDIAARAFRDAEGMVQLTIGHYVNYRMTGPDLNSVASDCTLLMRSDFDPGPSMFNDSEWLAAPYTEDGMTIYAIVHNEYRGDTHSDARPGQCPSGDRLTCLDTSVTMLVSTDGGDSYHDILEPPNHLVATMPYTFNDQGVPSGLRQPSNIIQGEDGYFYVFTNISDYPPDPSQFPPQWVCAMRTKDLSDPSSWRYWDGEGFTGRFVNPYIETVGSDEPKCAPLEESDLSGSLNESVTFNTALGRYIMVGYSFHPAADSPMWGIYYSLSDDLIHWTQRRLLVEIPGQNAVDNPDTTMHYAYPSLIDPSSPSMNFDTTGDHAYLYVTRYNGEYPLDRDLIRFPVQIVPPVYPIPTPWRFETDGDVEGWLAENQLVSFIAEAGNLWMESTGDDPYIVSPPITVPADEYNRLGIRMEVSAGGSTGGQLFFITDADSEWNEDKSLIFDVIGDGEYHDYVLDMSSVKGWDGVITQMRLDPVWDQERTIQVDIIAFVE